MKRLALAAALCLVGSTAAPAQHVISCPGVTGEYENSVSIACDGMTFYNVRINGGALFGQGDQEVIYMTSPTEFTFQSAIFQSELADPNGVMVFGFTVADIAGRVDFPPLANTSPIFLAHTYQASVAAPRSAPQEAVFNWGNVVAIAFANPNGGPVPFGGGGIAYDYDVSAITVTATPEPASLVLLATGLIGFGAVHTRRARRVLG